MCVCGGGVVYDKLKGLVQVDVHELDPSWVRSVIGVVQQVFLFYKCSMYGPLSLVRRARVGFVMYDFFWPTGTHAVRR